MTRWFRDFLSVLASEGVEALVVGGYAVSFHSKPRFTKDIDIFVNSTPENRGRLARSLERFGAPAEIVDAATAAAENEILWFGIPPTRIDLLFAVPGVGFAEAYARRQQAEWDGVPVSVIGKEDLMPSAPPAATKTCVTFYCSQRASQQVAPSLAQPRHSVP